MIRGGFPPGIKRIVALGCFILSTALPAVAANALYTRGSWAVDGDVLAVDVARGYAWVVGEFTALQSTGATPSAGVTAATQPTRGLRVFNVQNPANPILVGSWDSGSAGLLEASIRVAGNYAYMTWADLQLGRGGLEIFDVSNPGEPRLVGSLGIIGWPRTIQVFGNYAYVADHRTGLEVFSVANPTRPVRVGGTPTSGGSFDFAVGAGYVYAVWSVWDQLSKRITGRVQLYSLANPAQPVSGAAYATKYASYGVAKSGECVYVTSTDSLGKGELIVYRASNPAQLTLLTSLGSIKEGYGVVVSGGYIYVPGGTSTSGGQIAWLQEKSPAAPIELGQSLTAVASAYAGADGLFYLADSSGRVQILSVLAPPPAFINGTPKVVGKSLVLEWPAVKGYWLQTKTNLALRRWVDVAGSDLTNQVSLPLDGPRAFFRVAGP